MAFFSFLVKKKKEAPSGVEPLKLDINLPLIESVRPSAAAPPTPEVPSFSLPPTPSFEQPGAFREAEAYRGEVAAKDFSRSIDLLSAKLDNIRLMLENLNHRLDKMEAQQKKEAIRW